MWYTTGALIAIATAGCYHATIETGLPPSPQVIDKSFASGWIYGLVPPSTVSTVAKCPDGAAKIETQISFVNQLVSWLTFEIYSPMSIKVTCAAKHVGEVVPGAIQMKVGAGASGDSIRSVVTAAAAQSASTGMPVTVQVHPPIDP
jgi:hypothetical protein